MPMYRRHDRAANLGPGFSIRPRSQAALLEPEEDGAPAVVRVARQLIDAVRSLG